MKANSKIGQNDFKLRAVFGGEFQGSEQSSNLYLLSFSKAFGKHQLSFNYSPGIKKKFIFSSEMTQLLDTIDNQNTEVEYSEKFGLGYSYKFDETFEVFTSTRYFDENVTKQISEGYFDEDSSTYYIVPKDFSYKNSYWNTNLGVTLNLNNKLTFSVGTIDFMIFENIEFSDDEYAFDFSSEFYFSGGYKIAPYLNISAFYETNGSYLAGFQTGFETALGKFELGISGFYNSKRDDSFTGIIPTLSFATEYYNISVSGIKYLDSDIAATSKSFFNNKISSVFNNRFSNDKLMLAVEIPMSFKSKPKAQIIDIEIKEEIFPTLADKYLLEPIAVAKVKNLTKENLTVYPFVKISDFDKEEIQSKSVVISAGNTTDVPFYLTLSDSYKSIDQRKISTAEFLIKSGKDIVDDETSAPILINNSNSWDGNIFNLKYFVKRDLPYITRYAKTILSEHKTEIDTTDQYLRTTKKIEILFNHFADKMLYVSDPRAASEYVQFPTETIKLNGGDCDDLSVTFSALLEGVGIETAFIDYNNPEDISHVSVLVNTGIPPEKSQLLTNNENNYYIKENAQGKERIWIPVETTSLVSFNKSWETGAEKFFKEAVMNYGLAKGSVRIINIK